MNKIKILDNNALSPVISTLLVIGIVTSTIGVILVWGIPFIDNSKHESQFAMSKNDFFILENSVNQLIQTGSGARKLAYIANNGDSSTVYVKNSSTKMILWYSYNTTILNFTVYDLEDGDKNFKVHQTGGSGNIDDVSVWWLRNTCFLAGTKVLMSDGSSKNIEDVCVGDNVKSYDFDNNHVVDSEVSFFHVHSADEMDDYYLVINDDLCVTPNHLFFTDNGWVCADDLKVSDKLFSIDKKYSKINSIEKVYRKDISYDLSIKNTENFYVLIKDKYVLVHNSPPTFENGEMISNKNTANYFTGFPYKFTFINATNPDGGDIFYNYSFNGVTKNKWYDRNWIYSFIDVEKDDYEFKVQLTNNTNNGHTSNTSFYRDTYFGENIPYDGFNYNSTLVDYHTPTFIDVSSKDGQNNYTITTQKNIDGNIRIDLYDSSTNLYTLNGTLPIGKIWIFDLGSIYHNMQYSNNRYNLFFENGAIFKHGSDEDSPSLLNKPNIYESENRDILGFRVIQVKAKNGYDKSASGEGLVKLNMQTKYNYVRDMAPNSYIAKRKNISNFYVSFYNGNSEYWYDFLLNNYDFKVYDSDRIRYNHENIELILSSVIVSTDLVMI